MVQDREEREGTAYDWMAWDGKRRTIGLEKMKIMAMAVKKTKISSHLVNISAMSFCPDDIHVCVIIDLIEDVT